MFVIGIDVGTKHLALCKISDDDGNWSIVRWKIVCSAGSTANEIYAALNADADDIFDDTNGDGIVVIERQPLKNPTMTRIQHYLEMYCAVRGLEYVLQDAKIKLMYAATTTWWPRDFASDGEWTYSRRKKLAERTTLAFVEDTGSSFRDFYTSCKKKDDYADSFLHAMAHATKQQRVDQDCRDRRPQIPVRAREPTPKQRASGKLSASNVKWLLRGSDTPDDVSKAIADLAPPKLSRALAAALRRHFGSADEFLDSVNS